MWRKLERKFEKIVSQLRKRYAFLDDIGIDVCEGYGLEGATSHNPRQNAINIDLKALYKVYNTSRFVKRLGRVQTFESFVLLVLLHEIAHVLQFQTISTHRWNDTLRETDYDTASGHDECWLEKEADKWARREFRKINRVRK